MKVKIQTKLFVEDQEIKNEMLGLLLDSKLHFTEEDTKVTLDFKNHIMIRVDSSKKVLYKFLENEKTFNEVLIYPENISLDICIFTKKYFYSDYQMEVFYSLVDENKDIIYQVCWEDVQ